MGESGASSGSSSGGGSSYPPAKHFLRDLDTTSWQVAAHRLLLRAPLEHGSRTHIGSAALGFLASLVDISAAPVALIAGAPDWTATQNLSLHATGWLHDGPVVIDARLVRTGQNTVIVRVDVYDGHGDEDLHALQRAIDGERSERPPTKVASGVLNFARIPRSASQSAATFDPAALVGQERSMSPDEPPTGTMLERIGVEVVDAEGGVVEIAQHEYVKNSFGTINGGVLGAVFQAAAEAMRPGLVATDLQVHYLSQVRTGPARTSGTVLRDAHGHTVVELRAVDAGADDQLLALATVTLQHPPG